MNREDFKNWLDRPTTESDEIIIDTLINMIKCYDENVKLIEKLMLDINKLQKERIKENIKEEIEVLKVD